MKEKLREQENVVFPAGKIILLDGREIDAVSYGGVAAKILVATLFQREV